MKIKVEVTADQKRKVVIDEGATEQETAEKISRSLKYSIRDGSWWSVMVGFGESYFSAFGVFLQATAFQITLLASIPQLLSSLLQLTAVKLTNIFRSRQTIVLINVFLQACMLPLILLFSWLTKSVWVFIALVTLYFVFGQMASPAWSSWMGDLVNEDVRGRYFGKRNRYITFATFLSLVTAGLILNYFSTFNKFIGFAILFLIACMGRLVSCYYLSLKFEPKVQIREPKSYGFFTFLRSIHTNNFGIFSLFTMLMIFAVNIAGPLFVFFWLTYLNFSYLQLMVLIAAEQIVTFIMVTHWGANADHYGNKTILWASSYLASLIPLWWLLALYLAPTYIFPLAICIQVFSGFSWSGFNLSSSNFIYDSVEPENRIRLTSYYTALRGIAIFVGGTIGGLLIATKFSSPVLSKVFPHGFYIVLLLSFIARLSVTILFIKKIHDAKPKEHKTRFIHFVTTMPAQGLMFDSVVGLNRTIKKFREKLKSIESKFDTWESDYKVKTKN